MKERPIIFSGEMVRAILDGRKTQTRRVVKSAFPIETAWMDGGWMNYRRAGSVLTVRSPYGFTGDRLWVREAFSYCPGDFKDSRGIIYRADGKYNEFVLASEWLPSIFMPRNRSRITLEIVSVRVERLRSISVGDCCNEGAPIYDGDKNQTHGVATWYEELWDSINEKRGFGWKKNPWVWVIEFKRVDRK